MSSKEGHPSFQGFVKASGQAELWDKGAGKLKSGDQLVGWCRKHTTDYLSDTLIGNWNEERFDVTKLAQSKCLPSQYSHYFETTYSQGYSRTPQKVPEVLKYSRGEEPKVFPAHQPVLDAPEVKEYYNSFMTSSKEAYTPPNTNNTVKDC